MAVGLSVANLCNKILDHIRLGTAFAQPAGLFVKLHTADPGAAGATAASVVTTRPAATFGAAASGSMALSNTPSWSMTANETITHISVWDNATAGNFLWSAALGTAKAVNSGDTLTLTACTLSLSTQAA
jgi:hypothetical protein